MMLCAVWGPRPLLSLWLVGVRVLELRACSRSHFCCVEPVGQQREEGLSMQMPEEEVPC